ncbi:MAG TPA: sulfur oxidation c-type cytochrome SoxX [Burkholderiales bacterium]|jgi:sulfur-oxidizing protein SoxX|nr:sulfur oxidation c-type cytochrome SoxX [Burkholderiales bacterium]
MTMKRRVLATAAAALAACASVPVVEHAKIDDAELARITAVLKRDFRATGQAKMDRLEPDAVQRACNLHADHPPEAVTKPLEQGQLNAIRYPGGSLIGDWKSGAKIAASGQGMQWHEKPENPGGGGCYNCHQLAPQEASFGTLGPSLLGFGKLRGNGPEMQRYVYGKIYNAKAYNLCSQMPRFGHSGSLSEQQMKDLTAYLLDPGSPVNQ